MTLHHPITGQPVKASDSAQIPVPHSAFPSSVSDDAVIFTDDEITADNPAALQAAANVAMFDDTPKRGPVLAQNPPDTSVTLPAGVVTEDDILTTAEVRELTGVDEERLARIDFRKHFGRYLNEIVLRGVVSLGGREVTSEILDDLVMGDRDFLILEIRRATFGNLVNMTLKCPTCKEEFETDIDLTTDIPMKRLDDPSDQFFKVELRNGRSASVRLPSARSQQEVLSDEKATVAEQNTYMLAKCVAAIDGDSPTMTDIKHLSMGDRRTLLTDIADRGVGPQFLEVRQACTNCAEEFPLVLDLVDLFRG